ncbi:MAG: hypothetical protein IPN23_11295 [Elusimicrobia bacterium]|nr:hypothetical protein [Elusimicrobiota bacterium]
MISWKRDVLRMEYRTPFHGRRGLDERVSRHVGVRSINGVRAELRTASAEQAHQIAMVLELKVPKGFSNFHSLNRRFGGPFRLLSIGL